MTDLAKESAAEAEMLRKMNAVCCTKAVCRYWERRAATAAGWESCEGEGVRKRRKREGDAEDDVVSSKREVGGKKRR